MAEPALIRGGTATVYVSDMDRAILFYTQTLGLTLVNRIANEWAEIDAGTGFIIGVHPARPPVTRPAISGSINIEFRAIGTLEATVLTLQKRGVLFDGPI